MAKPQFQDIVPPDRRSIKKIPIPDRTRDHREGIRDSVPPPMDMVRPRQAPPRGDIRPAPRAVPPPPPMQEVQQKPAPEPRPRYQEPDRREKYTYDEVTPEATVIPRPPRRKRRIWPLIVGVIAIVAILALVYFLVPRVTGATITLIPKGQTVAVDSTFVASKDSNAELPYQVAVYGKDGKLTIPATGEENAQTKATGVIRIFNNYSEAEQKLVENTRFATPEGKIFRIDKAVTIPGKKGTTPGSIDVAVTADAVGESYNVGLADFTIPGFKGDPKYDKIYARSKTSIGGGFSGARKKVDPAQVESARQKIRTELQSSLVKQMQQNIPENFAFPKDSYFIEYESLPDTQVDGGVQLTERATFHGIMFKREFLAAAIAKKVSADTSNKTDLENVDTLAFSTKVSSSTPAWESDTFTFSLHGTTTLIASIDTDKLKNELKGKPRKSLNAILASYPGVEQAQVVMRPFWTQTFPDSAADITIKVEPAGKSQ